MPPRNEATAAREQLFLKHYLTGTPDVRFNGTRSVLACGWTTRENTAASEASRMLRRSNVQQAIQSFVSEDVSTVQKILTRRARRAYTDIDAVATWDDAGNVTFKSSDQIGPAGKAIIAGLTKTVTETRNRDGTITTRTEMHLKLKDSDGAERDMMKFHRLLSDRVEHTGLDGAPIEHAHRVQIELPRNGREVDEAPDASPPASEPAQLVPPRRALKARTNGRHTNGAKG